MPELPEVETVRQGLAKWVAGRTIDTVEVRHPRAIRRHMPGDEHFAAMLRGRTDPRRRPARQVPVAAAGLRRRDHRPPRHERPAADASRPSAEDEIAPAGPVHLHRRRAAAALRRPAHVRRPVGLRGRRGAAGRDRAHRPRPDGPALRRRGVRRRAAQEAHRGQAGAARPDADLRGGQHLRRRGVVARPAARRAADRRADQAGGTPAARPRPRRAGRGDRRRRHQLRRAVRQRQRAERLLRPVAERVRAGGRAVPALRHADPPRAVHEPVVVQLSALPARGPAGGPRGR